MRISKTLKRVSLLFVLLFPLLVQPTSALEYSTRFNTCQQLKKQYRFGVALNLKKAGDYPAKISKLIYKRNKGLDFDYDGIVCENHKLQDFLNPSTKTTTTSITPTPATSVPTVAPLPTSPQYVGFRNGGSRTLRKGVTYQIYTCSDYAGPTSYMDIFSTTNGWTQKAVGVDLLDATKCSSPGYPYRTSYGWSVIESPGQVTNLRLRGYVGGFLEMKVVITN